MKNLLYMPAKIFGNYILKEKEMLIENISRSLYNQFI